MSETQHETPAEAMAPETGTTTQQPFPILDELPPYVSPTLQKLDARLRPSPSTICEACPASVWLSGKDGVKCFCRVMHLITWSSEEPAATQACDGEVMANLERAAQLAAQAGE